jgi:hypothetical protein
MALQRAEVTNVQRLQFVGGIWREADEGDVLLLACVDHIIRNMAGQVVADQHMLARPPMDFW